MARHNPYLTLSMDHVDAAFLEEAEADTRAQVRDWLREPDPQWRSLLRDCLKDDLLWLRAWRAAFARNAASLPIAS